MRLIVVLLFFSFTGSAIAADGFGPRFAGNPPAAFLDGGASIMFGNIEPAAGGEESDTENAKTSKEETPTLKKRSLGNGLIRVYPEPLKK